MVMKTAPEIVSVPQQTEVVIEAPETEASAEILQKADVFIDRMVKKIEEQTEAYAMRVSVEIEAGRPESGAPMLPGGYQYWNCLTIGPIQFFRNPPYRPGKIVAAGEACLMLGLIWVNPALGPGASLPGTTVLGGRPFRARFEGINLTTVANGPDRTFTGTFSSPAPVVTRLRWFMPTPDPGVNPALYEVNLTADVTLGGQPFAAFSTWHYDPDYEPEFLRYTPWDRPTVSAHWQFERPARFLIYRP